VVNSGVKRARRFDFAVFSIDYDGEEVFHRLLRPGEAYMGRSYATHPWVVRGAPAESSDDSSFTLRVGESAALTKRRYSVLWNPLNHNISFMAQPSVESGDVRRELSEVVPQHSIGRLSQARALIIQQMRELRRDSLTNTSADMTVMILPRLPV